MTGKEHLQELFNSEDTERIAKFLSSDCSTCRIRSFCENSLRNTCDGVWKDWLESEI